MEILVDPIRNSPLLCHAEMHGFCLLTNLMFEDKGRGSNLELSSDDVK